jgi:hypothetical protein
MRSQGFKDHTKKQGDFHNNPEMLLFITVIFGSESEEGNGPDENGGNGFLLRSLENEVLKGPASPVQLE